MLILSILDIILFVVIGLNVIYVLFFAIASKIKYSSNTTLIDSIENKRIVVLIPAYKEDAVIQDTVQACIEQSYPQDKFDIVVISDKMKLATDSSLREKGAKVVNVNFENSTKTKALNLALSQLDEYDIALILDGDNIIESDFLKKINQSMVDGRFKVVQAHRVAKNLNNKLAILDAVSEEINNSLFRLGHVNVGLSSALIGSGMAFDFDLLKKTLKEIDAVGGFDRALELTLLREGIHFGYLPNAEVKDEKVHRYKDFSNQRRRWMSAQLHYFVAFFPSLIQEIKKKNWDFCDKYFQQISIPRLLLVGSTFLFSVITLLIDFTVSIKWWFLLLFILIAFLIAIPKRLLTKQTFLAIVELPYAFGVMFLNLFKMKGANKKFIHTNHGLKKEE